MDSWVKLCSPQNITGVSLQNSVASFSWTTEVDGSSLIQVARDYKFILKEVNLDSFGKLSQKLDNLKKRKIKDIAPIKMFIPLTDVLVRMPFFFFRVISFNLSKTTQQIFPNRGSCINLMFFLYFYD